MHYPSTPTWGHLAVATIVAFLLGYFMSIVVDRLFLKRGSDDRVVGIALSCALAFMLLMGATTYILTTNSPVDGPIIVPPVGYAVSFLIASVGAGIVRMRTYGDDYASGRAEPPSDHEADDRNFEEELVTFDDRHRGRNYFVRHWLGQLPLPLSYWVNGALLSAIILAVGNWLAARVEAGGGSLRSLAIVALLFTLITILFWAWSWVGIWRSARWHRHRGGSPAWGVAARAMILLTALTIVGRSGDMGLQASELGRLALGADPIGKVAAMEISPDGRELLVRGSLSQGAASRFTALLAKSPGVRTVVLTSEGGRMLEANRIAEAIRRRGLNTRVDDFCMSACISALLAGRDRSAPNLARIGFHQPSFPGVRPAELQAEIDATRTDYVSAGVNADFVQRALGTPAEDMWFPSADELIEANVLTGSDIVVVASGARPRKRPEREPTEESLGEKRLRSELKALAAHINSSSPRRLDSLTTLQRASASGLTLTYFYKVEIAKTDASAAKAEMARLVRRQLCGDKAMAAAVRDGGRFVFSYDTPSGNHLFDFAARTCSPA